MKKIRLTIISFLSIAISMLALSWQDIETNDYAKLMASCSVDNRQKHKFDFTNGNPGAFSINKAAEKITVDDIRKAITVTPLHPDATMDEGDTPHIWTASEVGLQDGSMESVGIANVMAIRTALDNENCIGFKLDRIYNVKLAAGGVVGYPESFKKKAIILPRDFVIDGEVDGNAVGGFHMDNNLFYTEHSLNMRKVHITCSRKDNFKSIYINPIHGIDQLQLIDCVFDYGYNFFIDSPDENPLDEMGYPVENNYINHIYVEGCKFRGPHSFDALDLRVTNSCRFINNTFTDFTVCPLTFSTYNKAKYAQTKIYMSCPIYIAGNTFKGNDYVYKSRYTNTGSSVYCCAFLMESGVVYALHNKISNIVTGRASFKHSKGVYTNIPATYDAYLSCQQVYYANNDVANVARFTSNRDNMGIFKAKNINMGYVKGGKPERQPIRYYKNNRYSLDSNLLMQMWRNRVYEKKNLPGINTADRDYTDEKNYDKSLIVDEKVLSINLNVSVVRKFVFKEVTFSNNILDAGNGSISGNLVTSPWLVNNFNLCNNTFKAAYITSGASGEQKGWRMNSNEKYRNTKETLFSIYLKRKYGKTSLNVIGNKFIGMKNASICLLVNHYSIDDNDNTKSAPKGDFSKVQGNTCPPGSEIKLIRLQRVTKKGEKTYSYWNW